MGPSVPGSQIFGYLPQLGTDQPHGLRVLYSEVQRQATMLAFNDIYRIVAIALIPLIPLFLLLPSRKFTGTTSEH